MEFFIVAITVNGQTSHYINHIFELSIMNPQFFLSVQCYVISTIHSMVLSEASVVSYAQIHLAFSGITHCFLSRNTYSYTFESLAHQSTQASGHICHILYPLEHPLAVNERYTPG